MTRNLIFLMTIVAMTAALSASRNSDEDVHHPAKMSKDDIAGEIFERPDVLEEDHGDHVTLDVTSLLSSDKKFATGMYRSGKVRSDITEPWGVDEFIYLIEGSITLTSSDGDVQTINAGEAATIPKEWTGVWDTGGYTKIWAIYSDDGSGLL